MVIVICYASRTGTKRNLAALEAAGWRLLVSATGVWRHEGFPYCLDPGAWTYHQQGVEFDGDVFLQLLELMGREADFIIAPDIVAGGHKSLDLSLSWMPRLEKYGRLVLIPAQDGLTPDDFKALIGPKVGIFLGGETEFKETQMRAFGECAAANDAYYHVGRVNTVRRFNLAIAAGADSVDGTSATRFAKTLGKLDAASKQQDLYSPRRAA